VTDTGDWFDVPGKQNRQPLPPVEGKIKT